MTCEACRAANPQISYQAWQDVPYLCADGRENKVKDFNSVTVPIGQFIVDFKEWLLEYAEHHNRAIFMDHDWRRLWNDPTRGGTAARPAICAVMDFANSYTHLHRLEHMQKFWSQVSTTMLGCGLRIPVANLNDAFFMKYGFKITANGAEAAGGEPHFTRESVLATLKKHNLPPVVTVMHVFMTSAHGHNTTTVQHCIKKYLMPWIWDYTENFEKGLLYFRTDNCVGQFKSARHMRFISLWSDLDCSKEVTLIWTHSEACHGKDISDYECGRCKWLLFEQEMRHTIEQPTEMPTAEDAHKWLEANHMHTKASLEEKEGKGTLLRVFHLVPYKEVPLLASLAEIKTLKDDATGKGVTEQCHLWWSTCTGQIQCREYACLNCLKCAVLKFGSCEVNACHGCIACSQQNFAMCQHKVQRTGAVHVCTVHRAAGGKEVPRLTQCRAEEMAATVKPGDLIGAECANSTEPFIVAEVMKGLAVWEGEPGRSWMGEIKEGLKYLTLRKYEKRGDSKYSELKHEAAVFYLIAEDLRIVFDKHKAIRKERTSSRVQQQEVKIFDMDADEMETLQFRVYMPPEN